MLEEDLDDTHLCIKCSSTIVGIDNYIQHRKSGCGGKTSRSTIVAGYAGFGYPDGSSVYPKSAEVEDSRGKGSKALNDPYDLPYELGADVFFSSLQLQSVQASGAGGVSGSGGVGGGGKASSRQQIITVKETSTLLSSASARDETEGEWHEEPANNSDNLMKVVRDIGESKKFEPIFQPISFTHNESPEPEQSDDDDEEDEVFEDDDEEDEDYVPTPYSGGKWKPGSQPPPRSGGKWKSKTQGVVELPPPPQVGGKCPFKAISGSGKLKSYARPAPAEKSVSETGGKWKPDSSKWKPCGAQESHDVLVPQTGGKWKPDSSKSDVPETGGKWKPGFAKSTPTQSTHGKESPDIMEEPAGDDTTSKSVKSPEVPETGGKWKPGYEKPQVCQRRRHSHGHDQPEVIMTHKWMPICSKKLKLHPPHTSGGKWRPGDDHESPVSMDHRSWSPESSKSLKTPPSYKWKSAEEQESPELLEPHTGGKWKPGQRPGSEVPTGGKWKPGHRPDDAEPSGRKWKQSSWDDHEAWEDADHTHPPVEHTKGKWIPGTKIDRLQFKEVEVPVAVQDFWCNICCRKLKTKSIYDKHLQSNAHLRKSETEEQLDRVAVEQLELSQRILHPPALLLERAVSPEAQPGKRKRRKIFIKCDICKYRMQKLLVGKHLISHYHFVRMAANPQRSFSMILEYIHQIVLQSPYQCVPCRFFANTEENFLLHWNSVDHRDKTEGPGKFWCSFCRFECEDNNQMRRHLLSTDHGEVILAINRSVPICITKKVNIQCPKCLQSFRYNMELRQHAARCDGTSIVPIGTASDEYQSRFRCELCPDEGLKSQTALQRHNKFKHNRRRFYCHVCDIEFQTAPEAVKHRKTSSHKKASAGRQAIAKKGANIKTSWDHVSPSEMEAVLQHIIHSDEEPPSKPHPRKCSYCRATFQSKSELKSHLTAVHPESSHACPLCGESFVLPHELGFHRRYKMCVASATKQEPPLALPFPSQGKVAEATKSWLCPECPFRSDLESELIFHQIMHTKGVDALQTTGKLNCPLCEKSLPRHSLRYHIRLHTNEKMFKCEHCEATFARRHNYKDHMRTMHAAGCDATSKLLRPTRSTAESFVCDTCGKIFRTKYALKYHSNIHMERDRKFLCPVEHCQYIGRNKAALQMHSSTHILQTEFKCEQNGCRYKGKTAYHLKRHMKNHSEPGTVLKCPECDFVAKRKAHIIRHRRIHTGEMPYECPHCDYKCAYVENLRKHILTTKKHPGKFIYECDKCDPKIVYKTNYNNEFQMHLIVAHPTQ